MKEPVKISIFWCGFSRTLVASLGAILLAFVLYASQVQAVVIKTDNPDLYVRFDNTVTYSVMSRLEGPDPKLVADPNTDDGDRNFGAGIVMNRLDLLSEFDAVYNKFGVRFSGAAWYDTMYNRKNDNDSAFTYNPVSVPHNKFTDETVKWHGKHAELLEAFTFGAVDMGPTTFRYRAGQFTQWWGDSFFLGWNGVAGALAPVNVAKAATLPNTQLKELILPIPQVAGSLQVTDNVAINGYYQFKWKPARLFATGSYFSPADLIGPGAERIWGPMFLKTDDIEPSDSGQFGISAKLNTMPATYGFYYNKFHAKDFYVVVKPIDGQYTFFYPEDIESYAVSGNMAWGQYTFAAEVTYRKNVPFNSDPAEEKGLLTVFPNFGPFVDMPHEPLYAKGDTLSILLNTFSGGMRGNFFCDAQDLIAEVAYVKQMSVNHQDWVDPTKDKDGLFAQAVYTPKWYQVLPGLDLTMPIGANYGFDCNPSTLLWGAGTDESGDFNVGIGGTYEGVWEFELTYRNFWGPWYNQAFTDRDYVSFYIRRAF